VPLLSLTNQYQISSLPGGFGLMYGYGWDGNFNEINGRINIDQGQLTLSTKDSTWLFSADFWQYLWVEGDASQPVDINNGRQDLQGVGVFFRVQFADKDTNPVDYIISAGVNAKGLDSAYRRVIEDGKLNGKKKYPPLWGSNFPPVRGIFFLFQIFYNIIKQ
jgi:hypothetical protein